MFSRSWRALRRFVLRPDAAEAPGGSATGTGSPDQLAPGPAASLVAHWSAYFPVGLRDAPSLLSGVLHAASGLRLALPITQIIFRDPPHRKLIRESIRSLHQTDAPLRETLLTATFARVPRRGAPGPKPDRAIEARHLRPRGLTSKPCRRGSHEMIRATASRLMRCALLR
jgi:hypothetical protein